MENQGTWDLSFLYQSFEDPAFAADFALLPQKIKDVQALLETAGDDREKLEKLMAAFEEISALTDRLGSFCFLTNAVDANNEVAAQQMDKLMVLESELSLANSALVRYVGGCSR